MTTTNLSQVWQTVQSLNKQEQFRLLQMLLQTFYQQWNTQEQPSPESQTIRGKYAFVPTSSETFAQRKAQEKTLE